MEKSFLTSNLAPSYGVLHRRVICPQHLSALPLSFAATGARFPSCLLHGGRGIPAFTRLCLPVLPLSLALPRHFEYY